MVQIIKDNLPDVTNPGWLSLVLLFVMLWIGLGEWGTITKIQSFGAIFEPQNFFSVSKYLGPIIVTFITKGLVK